MAPSAFRGKRHAAISSMPASASDAATSRFLLHFDYRHFAVDAYFRPAMPLRFRHSRQPMPDVAPAASMRHG